MFELVKKSRGAVLSWAWFFIKPAIYIFCFWFALALGLRVGSPDPSGPPYLLWLCAGIIPWFFMQDMLNAGVDVMHRYPYLVNKIKFPLSGISSIFTLATMIVQLMLMVALFVIYFACGMGFDVYLLQVPVLLALMFMFWDAVSILCSQLSAISKDFANLIHAMGTPFFWLSGVLFPVQDIDVGWIQTILDFNPITFFVTAFRNAFYDKTWFWEDTPMCVGFLVAFAVTVVVMAIIYRKFNEEVADVL
ncbi:ABC transporter [Eggerthellaceae bacterium zg-886]|uniref:Transport permease protein n=2 Tax=Xiamenia xianingshaonis TaxID=2682776 RepID=A0A9E6SV45_9ACTN|nr:ABC transporter [Xiamenia xianingshaonis]QTU85176.1 ABC transporter permease [Xiamenia xianingshaonis]